MDDGARERIGKSHDCIQTEECWHIIWDVKMDFTWKARWVKDSHKTPDSIALSYSGVILRESIRIGLMYAALLGLPVVGADIKNA